MKEYCSVYNEEGYGVIDKLTSANRKGWFNFTNAAKDAIEQFLALDCNRNLKFNIVDVCDMKVNQFVHRKDILVRDAEEHIVPQDKSTPDRRDKSGK